MIGKWAHGRAVRVAAFGLALTLGATQASAAIYDLTFSDDSGYSASFQLDPSSPSYYSGINQYFGQGSDARGMEFYSSSYGTSIYGEPVNLLVYDNSGNGGFFLYTGPQLYSGPESDPFLAPDTYTLTGTTSQGGSATTGHLTVALAPGPGSPAPEVGLGLLSALAAGAALLLTRVRRPGPRSVAA